MTSLAFPKPHKTLPAEKRRLRQVSKRPSARDKAMADRLCAALVKQRAGNKCEAKGYADHTCSRDLDWAHGIPRRFYSVRWAHANTAALCRVVHRLFTLDPIAFERWRIGFFGGPVCDAMAERARGVVRVYMAHVLADLRAGRTQAERS